MAKQWKKGIYILLSLNFLVFFGCGPQPKKRVSVVPKVNGSTEQKIEYHKKEVQKYMALKEGEEQREKRSLSRHDMEGARDAESRKRQIQKKIEGHMQKMNSLRGEHEGV